MIEYYAAYILIFMLPILLSKIKLKNKTKTLCTWYFFILFTLFGFRHQSMGIDLGYGSFYGYLGQFTEIASFSWKQVFTEDVVNYERGYIVFNKLISLISDDPQFLLICCAFVSIYPIFYMIYKKSVSPTFSLSIYMGLPVFMLLFSGLRQNIAIGICFCSILFIQERKLGKFLLCVLVASCFHSTAWIFLMAYPVYHVKLGPSLRKLTIPALAAVYMLRYPIFYIVGRLFKDNPIADHNGAISLFLVFVLIYVFEVLYMDRSEEENGLLNIFYIACCAQAIGGVYSTVLRIGYYFMTSLILLLPLVIQRINRRKDALLLKVLIAVCFVTFGLYSIRNSTWAQAYPYYWMWNDINYIR